MIKRLNPNNKDTGFKVKIPSLIMGLLFSTISFAGPREDLLALDHRPTFAEFEAAFDGNWPDENPFGTPSEGLQTKILKSLPTVIVQFEKAFPGATYAALGRDTAFLGDLMAAFYESLGQKNRVVRMDLSRNSLTNQQDLVAYLRTQGVTAKNLKNSTGLVVFDQTKFQEESQVRQILLAAYGDLKSQGIESGNLPKIFNAINTGASKKMYPVNIMSPWTDVAGVLRDQGRRLFYTNDPEEILSVKVDSSLTYTKAYHDVFLPFQRTSSDLVQTKPGPLASEEVRLQILADLFESVKTVSSPLFLERVRNASSVYHFGYLGFPTQRVLKQTEAANLREGFQIKPKLIDELPASPAAERILQLSENLKSSLWNESFSFGNQIKHTTDFLIAVAQGSEQESQEFAELFRKDDLLRSIVIKMSPFFLYGGPSEAATQAAQKLFKEEWSPMSFASLEKEVAQQVIDIALRDQIPVDLFHSTAVQEPMFKKGQDFIRRYFQSYLENQGKSGVGWSYESNNGFLSRFKQQVRTKNWVYFTPQVAHARWTIFKTLFLDPRTKEKMSESELKRIFEHFFGQIYLLDHETHQHQVAPQELQDLLLRSPLLRKISSPQKSAWMTSWVGSAKFYFLDQLLDAEGKAQGRPLDLRQTLNLLPLYNKEESRDLSLFLRQRVKAAFENEKHPGDFAVNVLKALVTGFSDNVIGPEEFSNVTAELLLGIEPQQPSVRQFVQESLANDPVFKILWVKMRSTKGRTAEAESRFKAMDAGLPNRCVLAVKGILKR